jgi:hypothetical protein
VGGNKSGRKNSGIQGRKIKEKENRKLQEEPDPRPVTDQAGRTQLQQSRNQASQAPEKY